MKRMMWLVMLALLTTAFSSADEFRGMIKPVNVKDDNGQHNGQVGTGVYSYSMLWLDAYYTPVDPNGGGRHAGVDVACPSGTPIFAVCDAYIDFSLRYNFVEGDNGGWGGTAILTVQDQDLLGGEDNYISAHHLRKYNSDILDTKATDPNGGIWVSIGTWLGDSGGATTDAMHGKSTAAHLDFRVTKGNSPKLPWFPDWPDWVTTEDQQNIFGAPPAVRYVESPANIPDEWDYYVANYKQYESLFSNPPQTREQYETKVPPVRNFTHDPMKLIQDNLVKVGEREDGTFNQNIINRYNLYGNGAETLGAAYADNGTLDNWNPSHVHTWDGVECQNVQNGKQRGVLMENRSRTRAYVIIADVWECYRKGHDGHFGPDIRLLNGRRLGCPTGDYKNDIQWFENGFFTREVGDFQQTKSASAKSGEVHATVVELRQTDGTLVETYYPSGEFSSLTLSGIPVSENQVVLAWLGGPVCDYYLVIRNGQQVGTVVFPEFTEVGLSSGTGYTYQVIAMSNASGELASSNQVGIVTPGQAGTFTLQGAPEGSSYVYLQWQNSLYDTRFFWLYRNGVLVAKTTGSAFSDFPLEPSTSYTYQVAAVTFSGLVFGWSNPVVVTTDPAPPEPPTPDPVATSVQIQVEPSWLYATDGWG